MTQGRNAPRNEDPSSQPGPSTSAGTPADAALEALQDGIDAFGRGEAESAIRHVEKALAIEPENAAARHCLGRVLAAEGRLAEAIAQLEAAREIDGGDLQVDLDLAQVRRQHGLHTALDAAIAALERDPKSAVAHFAVANLLRDLGRHDEARDHYKTATKLMPDFDEAFSSLGDLMLLQGDHEGAAAQYRKVAETIRQGDTAETGRRLSLANAIPFWHVPMLNDQARNTAYEQAITRAVAELDDDAVVLDIGAGSGLLAMMAARAGARRVVACEMSRPLARVAARNVARNGLADRVRIAAKKSTSLEVGRDLPAPASLVVSELVDDVLLGDKILPTMRHAVTNLMAPDGRVLPAAATVWGVVIEIPAWRAVNPIREVAGFDLSEFSAFQDPLADMSFDHHRHPHRRFTEPFQIARIDFRRPPAGTLTRSLELRAEARGTSHAVAFWWDLHLDDEVTISNRSEDPSNHWRQAIHYLDRELALQAGQGFTLVAGHTDTRFVFRTED